MGPKRELFVWGLLAFGLAGLSCGPGPAKEPGAKGPLTDFLAKEMKLYYERGTKPCAGCPPDYFLDVIEGLELHQKGEWERSNRVLRKAYREDADQALAVIFFLSLNHGMLGSYPESRQWGERALSLHVPEAWIVAVLEDPRYGDLFKRPQMRWLPYFLERSGYDGRTGP